MAGVARGPEGEAGLRERLKAGLGENTTLQQGPPSELAGRMVGQALRALTTPPRSPTAPAQLPPPPAPAPPPRPVPPPGAGRAGEPRDARAPAAGSARQGHEARPR
ncbi:MULTISPECIES: hypothetical protein [unclassified Streptomyces]|uniref:hypothetical protein n=1 Tax=unclassified Streptomyces TaxID=2593676 RepID=UPI002E357197|nr:MULTISPECIES: hypothetical protein [unclassified Streptomyces]WUC68404.1 hypothetical protein OG861_31525 [Streptomyces sp. NBC_00539]